MRDLASPVGAFVRERCEVGADKTVEIDKLYEAYKTWCEENEHPKPSKQVFGRDLRAAVPVDSRDAIRHCPADQGVPGIGVAHRH